MTNSAGPTPADRYPRDKMRFSHVKIEWVPSNCMCPSCRLVMAYYPPAEADPERVPHETRGILRCHSCDEAFFAPQVELERVEQQG